MSFDESGMDNPKHFGRDITISIKNEHPLVALANSLCWQTLLNLVLSDLKSTTKKGCWWRGRALRIRIHLGAYLLQQLFNSTDRKTEYDIKDNAAYQLFCGYGVVKKWHCPDHTKIEEFRSRLSPETQRNIANIIASHAVKLGFADCSDIDIDSTIQEANITYPTDSSLLCKLGSMAKKVAAYMNNTIHCFTHKPMEVNMTLIKSYARRYFFLPKKADSSLKHQRLKELFECVKSQVELVAKNAQCLAANVTEKMTWNMANTFSQFNDNALKYLSDVDSFLDTGSMVKDKILSFHLKEVKCFIKEKPGKKYHFGRMFQIGRIKGNFLFATKGACPSMPDKLAIAPMIKEHKKLFEGKPINSVATDKGYYSKKNEKLLFDNGVNEIGIQRPANIKSSPIKSITDKVEQKLNNRRSGIEPLIGHVKHGGQLGKSRMKSDSSIESSGFSAILGFNLRQMIRYQTGKASLHGT